MDSEARLAVVNYKNDPVKIKVCPLDLDPDAAYELTDLRTRKIFATKLGRDLSVVEMKIEGKDFIVLGLALKSRAGRSYKR